MIRSLGQRIKGRAKVLFGKETMIQERPPRAVIFDLGGTLIEWPRWIEDSPLRWRMSYDFLISARPDWPWPTAEEYVRAMREAEAAHWHRVENERWSGPPSGVVREGFAHLGCHVGEAELLAALDGYARAVDGWAVAFPDARSTLRILRQSGYRLGLLSNTWWAADWHNADLAAHNLADCLDEIVYTSDLPHSKPHPSVFRDVAARLGVAAPECVMVGDRLVDDISGALGAGMRAIWKSNNSPWPRPREILPTGVVDRLDEVPTLLRSWGGR